MFFIQLAFLVSQILQLGRGKSILQSLVDNRGTILCCLFVACALVFIYSHISDMKSLYYTGRALLLSDPIPRDIYPYILPSEMMQLVKVKQE